MIALLGHPPPELVARFHSMPEYQWPEPVKTADGEAYDSAEQYFGGPLFDHNGIWNLSGVKHQTVVFACC